MITASNLHRSYSIGKKSIEILHGVDLHIAAGETAHRNIQAGSPDVILPEQPAGVILGGLFPQVEAKTG